MAAEGGNNIVRFTYTGAEGEIIDSGEATHIFVHKDVSFVRAWAFLHYDIIVEIICHNGVERIEKGAFCECPNLRRVIMPGVKIVEAQAFGECPALEDVECDKLEIIKEWAFADCKSLRSINLPSARTVGEYAFDGCNVLTDVQFGRNLERIEGEAFNNCPSLERITIPLKNGLFAQDDIFMACRNLNHVDLVEGAELHEFVAALHLEEWRNEMNDEIDAINRVLPDVDAGGWDDNVDPVYGKASTIGGWIIVVLRKINHYKSEHQRMLGEAGSSLQHVLPHDIVMNNVLSFLELPPYTFEVEDSGADDQEDDSDDEEDMEE